MKHIIKRVLLCIALLISLSSFTTSISFIRMFHYADDDYVRITTLLLFESSNIYKVVELDPYTGHAITGDTLTMWVQHYFDGATLNPIAYEVDLVLTCFPELLRDSLDTHVFRDAYGEVWATDYINYSVFATYPDSYTKVYEMREQYFKVARRYRVKKEK